MRETITVRGKLIGTAGLISAAFFVMQGAFYRHRQDWMVIVCVTGFIVSLAWALGLGAPRDSSKTGK